MKRTSGVFTSDDAKKKLASLQERVDTHDRAVSKLYGIVDDSARLDDYRKTWSAFKLKVSETRSDAESWLSPVLESTVDNLDREFGILITEFSTLQTRISLDRGKEKQKALEYAVSQQGKTPTTKAEEYAKDHVVRVESEAKAAPITSPAMSSFVAPPSTTSVLVPLGIGALGVTAVIVLLRVLLR